MTKPHVLLADEHRLFLEGVRGLLQPHFDVVGIASDGWELIEAAKRLNPAVIVLDIPMPSLNGIAAARHLRAASSQVKLVFLTAHAEAAYVARAVEAGASAYVLKQSAPAELLTAIRVALEGGTYIIPGFADSLGPRRQGAASSAGAGELTSRQRQVLQLVATGHSAKQIATLLNISRRTAEFHKARLMQILGARSTTELIKYALNTGIGSG